MTIDRQRLTRLLQLFALCAFALQQPLLDILARETGFLIARGSSPGEIVTLVIALMIVPPLLLFGFELIAVRVSHRAELLLHQILGSGLVFLILLPLLEGVVPATLDLFLALAAAVGLFALSSRLAVGQSFLSVLGIAPILFALLFFSNSSVSTLVFARAEASEHSLNLDRKPPLVMVIFDELSVISLLDRDGAIDRIRYPAFARLADESHWLRNASAVDWRTLQVLPSILTGRYPQLEKKPAVAAQYPKTLFSLLAPYYEMNITETQTRLYSEGKREGSAEERATSLYADLFMIYLHVVLPKRYAEELPAVDRTWKDFDSADLLEEATSTLSMEITVGSEHGDQRVVTDRASEFRRFIASIGRGSRPGFHFLHTLLPHSPWEYVESGTRYRPSEFIGSAFGIWVDEPWWAIQAQQRHLLQLAFVDRLLGELIEHLEEIGLYDEALLVVTADHGVSFWPEGAYRDFAQATHPGDILSVPLFVKEPGQRLGSVRRESVQSVDVTPIILERLGAQVPWLVDGCSVFADDCRANGEKVGFSSVEYSSEENRRLTFPVQIGMELESLDRQFEIFGDGGRPMGLYRIGPYKELIETSARNRIVSGAAVGGVRLSHEIPRDSVSVRVRGTLELTSEAPKQQGTTHVAVTVDGTIWAIVPAVTDGRNGLRKHTGVKLKLDRYVSAMLPESVVSQSSGEGMRLYLVSGEGADVKLHPLVTR
jgi:hypothetical protein